MCGKFAAQASWAETTRIIESLTGVAIGGDAQNVTRGNAEDMMPASNDHEVTYRVMSQLPVIVWDRALGVRRIIFMRWGFPHRADWRRPDPIHARAETIDSKPTFRDAFLDGQRGIVLAKTFNEAPDIPGPTIQHTITPDTEKNGIAVIWRSFEVGAAMPLLACVMVTVPANKLIAGLPTDRMPALLDDADWEKWIGEQPATVDELKATLKTAEGLRWRMNREERAATTKRRKPTVSDPGGLF